MNEYYLHDGESQARPFSIEELSGKQINRDTLGWKEGMTEWEKAGDVTELKSLFASVPPPLPTKSSAPIRETVTQKITKPLSTTEEAGTLIGRYPKVFFAILILLIAAGFIIYKSQNSGSSNTTNSYHDSSTPTHEKTAAEVKEELKQKESENPTDYLKTNMTRRENFIDQTVIEGSIINTASTATFKDMVIEVSYLSKTKAVIAHERFTIYDVVAPQRSVSITKIKTSAPSDTKDFRVDVVNAVAVE